MGEYTPTTDEIRDSALSGVWGRGLTWAECESAFDRWLEAHDAQVASEAAEKALRDAADVPGAPYTQKWLRARADRLAQDRHRRPGITQPEGGIMSNQFIDTTAPVGMETLETSHAKETVYDIVSDSLEYHDIDIDDLDPASEHDPTSIADRIVESLIVEGWRPTAAVLALMKGEK